MSSTVLGDIQGLLRSFVQDLLFASDYDEAKHLHIDALSIAEVILDEYFTDNELIQREPIDYLRRYDISRDRKKEIIATFKNALEDYIHRICRIHPRYHYSYRLNGSGTLEITQMDLDPQSPPLKFHCESDDEEGLEGMGAFVPERLRRR